MALTKVSFSMILGAYLNALDYGMSPSASAADNATALQAAVDAAAGRKIYIPQGTYNIGAQVVCPSGTWLVGDGAGETILNASADVSPLLFQDASVVDYTAAGISYLTVKGSGAAVRLVTVNNVWGFVAEHCRVYGSSGVLRCFEIQRYSFECQITSCRITDADESCIYLNEISGELPNGCWIQNCDFAPNNGGYCIYDEAGRTRIIGNWFEFAGTDGGTGVYSVGSPIIIGNKLSGGYNGTAVVNLVGTNGAVVSNNQINVYGTTMNGVVVSGCTNTNITDNNWTVDAAQYCVIVTGSCTDTMIQGNNMKGIVGGAYGLTSVFFIGGSTQSTIVDSNIYNFQGSDTGIGVTISDGATLVDVTNNQFLNMVTGVDCNTNASSKRVNLIDNWFNSCTTAVDVVNKADLYFKNNYGFVTENSGYPETIPSGSTSVVVTHGLALTPDYQDIRLTPVDTTTNSVGPLYITAKSSTTFTVSCRADPGASGYKFAWSASIDQ